MEAPISAAPQPPAAPPAPPPSCRDPLAPSCRDPLAGSRRSLWARIRHHGSELLLTAPSFLWMTVFFVLPTLLVLTLTFRPTALDGGIGTGWTLQTWKTISNPNYPAIVWRTVWLSFAATALCIVISLPCAFAMARIKPKWRSTFVGLVILPFWTSFLIRVFAWRMLLHPEGWLSSVFHRTWSVLGWQFHLLEPQTTLLYNPVAVLLVMVYTYLPFAILPIYASAEKFDFSLLEAAYDLGAKPWRVFWRIFVPGVRAGIFSAVLMVLIPALGSYVIPDMVGGPNSEMVGTKIYQRAIPDRNLPHASALSALLMLGVLLPPGLAWLVTRKRHLGAVDTDVVAAMDKPVNLGNSGGRRRNGGRA